MRMLSVVPLMLLAANSAPNPQLQILAGPSFEALLHRTQAQCPASKVRYTTPAALLDAEDAFKSHLDRHDRLAVSRAIPRTADGVGAKCAGRDGASCPANAELAAFEKVRLLGRFAAAVCAHGAASWN